jgi:hypothetical protein
LYCAKSASTLRKKVGTTVNPRLVLRNLVAVDIRK